MSDYNPNESTKDRLIRKGLLPSEADLCVISKDVIKDVYIDIVRPQFIEKPMKSGRLKRAEKPRYELIVSQPGGGKLRLMSKINEDYLEEDAFYLQMDEGRHFHPHIGGIMILLKKYPEYYNYMTQDFAYGIEGLLLQDLAENGINIIHEVSLNAVEYTNATIDTLKSKYGYEVGLNALGTDAITSSVSNYKRFAQQFKQYQEAIFNNQKNKRPARLANASYHEQAYNNMIQNMGLLEGVDVTRVFERIHGEKPKEIYTSSDPREFMSAKDALVTARENCAKSHIEINKKEIELMGRSIEKCKEIDIANNKFVPDNYAERTQIVFFAANGMRARQGERELA